MRSWSGWGRKGVCVCRHMWGCVCPLKPCPSNDRFLLVPQLGLELLLRNQFWGCSYGNNFVIKHCMISELDFNLNPSHQQTKWPWTIHLTPRVSYFLHSWEKWIYPTAYVEHPLCTRLSASCGVLRGEGKKGNKQHFLASSNGTAWLLTLSSLGLRDTICFLCDQNLSGPRSRSHLSLHKHLSCTHL